MPEGDTVHKLAVALAPIMVGQRLLGVRARRQDWGHLVGLRFDTVTSRGKYLLMDLGGRWTLRSHLGLYGSWHCYGLDASWRRPERQASLVLTISDRVFVLFNARELELLVRDGFSQGDAMRRLGPDLTREEPQPSVLWARALERLDRDTPVVDLLLDQRVASGVGNVYKSEALFLTGCSPFVRLADLTPEDLTGLYRTAAQWLRRNLGGGPRITREIPDGRGPLWVYGRAGLPCLRCGTEIRRLPLGRNPRSTYWCPRCQVDRPSQARAT